MAPSTMGIRIIKGVLLRPKLHDGLSDESIAGSLYISNYGPA